MGHKLLKILVIQLFLLSYDAFTQVNPLDKSINKLIAEKSVQTNSIEAVLSDVKILPQYFNDNHFEKIKEVLAKNNDDNQIRLLIEILLTSQNIKALNLIINFVEGGEANYDTLHSIGAIGNLPRRLRENASDKDHEAFNQVRKRAHAALVKTLDNSNINLVFMAIASIGRQNIRFGNEKLFELLLKHNHLQVLNAIVATLQNTADGEEIIDSLAKKGESKDPDIAQWAISTKEEMEYNFALNKAKISSVKAIRQFINNNLYVNEEVIKELIIELQEEVLNEREHFIEALEKIGKISWLNRPERNVGNIEHSQMCYEAYNALTMFPEKYLRDEDVLSAKRLKAWHEMKNKCYQSIADYNFARGMFYFSWQQRNRNPHSLQAAIRRFSKVLLEFQDLEIAQKSGVMLVKSLILNNEKDKAKKIIEEIEKGFNLEEKYQKELDEIKREL